MFSEPCLENVDHGQSADVLLACASPALSNRAAGQPARIWRRGEAVLDGRGGICIDRQVRRSPPEPGMRIDRADLRLIKSMRFEFVKLLLNPAVLKSGNALNPVSMAYFDQVIDMAAAEKLPVVVCIHPEDDFKRRRAGIPRRVRGFLQFHERNWHITWRAAGQPARWPFSS